MTVWGKMMRAYVPLNGMPLAAACRSAVEYQRAGDGSDMLLIFNGAIVTVHGSMTVDDVERLIRAQLQEVDRDRMRFVS